MMRLDHRWIISVKVVSVGVSYAEPSKLQGLQSPTVEYDSLGVFHTQSIVNLEMNQ